LGQFNFFDLDGGALVFRIDFADSFKILERQMMLLKTEVGLSSTKVAFLTFRLDLDGFVTCRKRLFPILKNYD
jgi:hypothetical protein